MAPREHIEYVETLAHNPVSVQLWATLTIATAELCQRFDSCKKSFPFRLGLCWVRLVWRCRKCTNGEWLNHSLEKKLNFLCLGTSVGSSSCQAVSSVSCTTLTLLTLRLSGPPELLQLLRWPQDRHMDFWPEPDRDIGDIGNMNTIQQVCRASYQLGPENCKDSLHAKILRKRVPKNCNKFGLQSALKLQHFSLFMSGAWSLWRWPFVASPNFSSLNIDEKSWPKFLALTPNPWQTSASKSTKRRISGTSSHKSWRVVCFWVYFAVEMILIVWITLCKFSPCLGLCSSSSSIAMLLTIIQQWIPQIEMIFHPRFTAFSDAPWNFYAFSYFSFDLARHE